MGLAERATSDTPLLSHLRERTSVSKTIEYPPGALTQLRTQKGFEGWGRGGFLVCRWRLRLCLSLGLRLRSRLRDRHRGCDDGRLSEGGLGGCGERNAKIGDCDKYQSTREIVGRRVQATDLDGWHVRTRTHCLVSKSASSYSCPNNFGGDLH
jgi:hypothetical protein